MKTRTKTSTKVMSALLIFISIALSVLLFAGASIVFLRSMSDAPVFAPEGNGGALLSPDMPSAPLEPVEGNSLSLSAKKISFICAGDNLIHTDVYGSAARYGAESGKEYDFDPMFEDVRELISSYDYAFLNQEVLIAGEDRGFSGYPCFNSPDELGDAVVTAGFDIINMATNHMLDKRNAGLKSAIDYWRAKPVTVIGDYLNREEYETVEYVENGGLKIALLAYTYGTNGIPLQNNGDEYVVPYIDEDDIKEKVAKAKKEADLVFVSIHWGDENTPTPNATQKKLAEMMADIGVDVIIGHHSHSIQPTEWLTRPDGGRTLVTYSLGNLLSGMQSPINIVGGMLSFDVEYIEGGLTPSIENVKIIPTVCHFSGYPRDYKVYLFTSYTRQLAARHRISGKLDYDGMKKLVTDTIADEFLTEDFMACEG